MIRYRYKDKLNHLRLEVVMKKIFRVIKKFFAKQSKEKQRKEKYRRHIGYGIYEVY
jgi:hypothetical protein